MTSKQNGYDVFVVSAPSGTGKTTLNRRLVENHSDIEIAVSYTTREKRPGELAGVHYHFTDEEAFNKLVAKGKMLEWARVFNHFYGTGLDEVQRITSQKHKAILEIDVQGWKQAQKMIQLDSVFILPPSMKDLWDRLCRRGSDEKTVRWQRFQTARSEIEKGIEYRHFIVNDDLELAYRELDALIGSRKPEDLRLSNQEGQDRCRQLMAEFDSAAWVQDLRQQIM